MNNPFAQVQQVNFLDIGCSNPLNSKWFDLLQLQAYAGFEPKISECKRLSREPLPYKSSGSLFQLQNLIVPKSKKYPNFPAQTSFD